MAGQYYDSESSLFYNWNRYYNPAIGRYISSDPIGLGGVLNTFLYAKANPVMLVDPLGLIKKRPPLGRIEVTGEQYETLIQELSLAIPHPRLSTQIDAYHYIAWFTYLENLRIGRLFLEPCKGDLPQRYLVQTPGIITDSNGNLKVGIYEYVILPGTGSTPFVLYHAFFKEGAVVTGYEEGYDIHGIP